MRKEKPGRAGPQMVGLEFDLDLDIYFNRVPGSIEIDLALLSSSWNSEGGTMRDWDFMSRAAKGEIPKREPISVLRKDDGKFVILDGNSTFAVAQASGWPRILALEFPSEEEFRHCKRR